MSTRTETTSSQGPITLRPESPEVDTSVRVNTSNTDVFEVADTVPEFDNYADKRQWMLEEMAGAFRIFARKGYGIGSAGHISVRDPEFPDRFWLNPLGRHFGTLKASDMVLVDHEGNVIGGSRKPVNKAGFQIHGAVHRARPDVIAACHTHSVYGKAYSAFGRPVEMLSQDSCAFYNDVAVYEAHGGVVLSEKEGENIAKALGNKRNLILQNHGLLTAGTTVGEAAFLFILLEQTCQCQLQADASQYPKRLISDEAAEFTFKATAYPEGLWSEFKTELEYEEFVDGSFRG